MRKPARQPLVISTQMHIIFMKGAIPMKILFVTSECAPFSKSGGLADVDFSLPPALKKADVGIAMGGVGSDIAVDAADIALVDDEVKELPHLVALSRRMMTTIKLNLTFSMTLNFIAIALVHNAGSVLVITNSAFLLNWRKKT